MAHDEHKSCDSAQPATITLYLPSRYPSARDLADILILFESSFVWSQIALATEACEEQYRLWRHGGENRNEAERLWEAWRVQFEPLTASFDKFLSTKYDPIIFHAQAFGAPPYSIESLARLLGHGEKTSQHLERLLHNMSSEYPLDPARQARNVRSRYAIDGEAFNVNDFSQWIGEYCGRNLLAIKTINPHSSIEFGFDLAAISAIVVLQNYPTVKDTLTYLCGVLRSYVGNIRMPAPKPGMEPPRLTRSMLQLLGQYDEVNLVLDGANARFELHLKR